MDYDLILKKQRELTPQEMLGKQMRKLFGRNLDYAEFVYLVRHPLCTDLDHLRRSPALREQEKIREGYLKYRDGGLTEEDFFPRGEDVIAEPLLRYVDIPPHKHDFLECAYVINGRCLHRINGNDFIQEAGSFVFIPYGTTHVLLPSEESTCLTIKVRTSAFLKMSFPEIFDFLYPIAFHCEDDPVVLQALLQILHQQRQGSAYHERIIFHLFQTMLLYILQNYRSTASVMTIRARRDSQLLKLLNYTASNYQTVTLGEIADKFHYNLTYLSRMFKEETGQSFSSMLREYKLRKAAELLLSTKLPLEDVCQDVGYQDVTQFIRSFKKQYGVTPGKYRQSSAAIVNEK